MGEPLIGTLEITLPGGTGVTEKANRVILLSSRCSGERDMNMNFVYEGGLMETMGEGGDENHGTITGVPKMPAGWTNGLGVTGGPKNEEILEVINLNGANVWSKAGHTVGEKVIVKVEQEERKEMLPGYYTATYCVQQIID
ncbi:hypothetical protein GL409_04725 [Salmonella enterica]|nr:hypothetical protein [Salmonella enterica]